MQLVDLNNFSSNSTELTGPGPVYTFGMATSIFAPTCLTCLLSPSGEDTFLQRPKIEELT
jgi:hypothetical protein